MEAGSKDGFGDAGADVGAGWRPCVLVPGPNGMSGLEAGEAELIGVTISVVTGAGTAGAAFCVRAWGGSQTPIFQASQFGPQSGSRERTSYGTERKGL